MKIQLNIILNLARQIITKLVKLISGIKKNNKIDFAHFKCEVRVSFRKQLKKQKKPKKHL